MTETLRELILALTGSAAVCALAMAVCPEGRVKGVLRLVCGVVMAVALLSPFLRFDPDAYAAALARYRDTAEEAAAMGTKAQRGMERSIIQADCAAYILDKASSLGVRCEARVTARWSGENGCFYPYEAVIACSGGEKTRSALEAFIASELGIPAERVTWEAE